MLDSHIDQDMAQISRKGDLITQYLLGVLPEPQRVALEVECFADKERFEEVAAAENDLIDDYLRGKLSRDEHAQFEQHFLSSPRRRERVHAAKILLRSISSGVVAGDNVRRPTPLRYSWSPLSKRKNHIWALAAAAAILLALGGIWLTIETSRLRNQVLQAQAEQAAELERRRELDKQLEAQSGRAQQLSEELASLRDQLTALEAQSDKHRSASTNVLSFFLTAALARGNGGETQTLTIPPGIQAVKLRLTLKRSDYQSYRAVVRTPEGAEIWNQAIIPTPMKSGAVVMLQIPASRFARNDYILKIMGTTSTGEVDDASSYYFRVER